MVQSSERSSVEPEALTEFLAATTDLAPDRLSDLGPIFARIIGAMGARILIVDYAHELLIPLGEQGARGDDISLEGTVAGRVFCLGEAITTPGEPAITRICLSEGAERFGVIEIEHGPTFKGSSTTLDAALRILILTIVSKRRYTDVVLRSRRARPLSIAAEMQWDLLPPLSCSTPSAAISGTLEPAYSTGGDSFDYAVNANRLDFAIIDAVGHGLPAILKSALAVNTIRNARREGAGLADAYREVDRAMEQQFGDCYYVTGILGSIDMLTAEFVWINAGHHLPLLVRNGALCDDLICAPSLPMGLGGDVVEVMKNRLQADDRILFFTDGVIEGRAADGSVFGVERLGELFVRASLDEVSTAETTRRLTRSLLDHCSNNLRDDATLVVVHFKGEC
jgi:serine phosphatase RsbU (regulator of sigma subunit)